MFDRNSFEVQKRTNAKNQNLDDELKKLSLEFVIKSDKYNYGYQWCWLGMPIIQLPADILAVQEIIWDTQPDIIIETGIAWGGSIVYYASILELIGKGKVMGIDIKIPEHNFEAIMKYPFSKRISLYKGSSTDTKVQNKIMEDINKEDSVMVLLDSNHTHEHVLQELQFYANLVTRDQFLVVSDTIVEDIPVQSHRPRPWGPGDNPKTALTEFLESRNDFEEDNYINSKLLTSFTPNGYLKRIK